MENTNMNNMPMPESNNTPGDMGQQNNTQNTQGQFSGGNTGGDNKSKYGMFIVAVLIAALVVFLGMYFTSGQSLFKKGPGGNTNVPSSNTLPDNPSMEDAPIGLGDTLDNIDDDLNDLDLASFDDEFVDLENEINQL